MRRRYNYIKDEMLTTLDGISGRSPHFARLFVLGDRFGLLPVQADRVVEFWRSDRQIKASRMLASEK